MYLNDIVSINSVQELGPNKKMQLYINLHFISPKRLPLKIVNLVPT